MGIKASRPPPHLETDYCVNKAIRCPRKATSPSMKVLLQVRTPSVSPSISKSNNSSQLARSVIIRVAQFSPLTIRTLDSTITSELHNNIIDLVKEAYHSKTTCWPWPRTPLTTQLTSMMERPVWHSSTRSGSRILNKSSTLPQSK